jgi:hypothetical protein
MLHQPVEEGDGFPYEKHANRERGTKYMYTSIFFDLEFTQDNRLECHLGYLSSVNNRCVNCKTSYCGIMKHRPNLCVAHKICGASMSYKVTPSSECEICGQNTRVFLALI